MIQKVRTYVRASGRISTLHPKGEEFLILWRSTLYGVLLYGLLHTYAYASGIAYLYAPKVFLDHLLVLLVHVSGLILTHVWRNKDRKNACVLACVLYYLMASFILVFYRGHSCPLSTQQREVHVSRLILLRSPPTNNTVIVISGKGVLTCVAQVYTLVCMYPTNKQVSIHHCHLFYYSISKYACVCVKVLYHLLSSA